MRPETETFLDQVYRLIDEAGAGFDKPEDDWGPILFSQGEQQDKIVAAGIIGNGLRDERSVLALSVILRENEAQRFALMLNMWTVPEQYFELPDGEFEQFRDEWMGRFDEHPEALEVLTLLLADEEETYLLQAEIERSDSEPPTLSEWRYLPTDSTRYDVPFMELSKMVQCELV